MDPSSENKRKSVFGWIKRKDEEQFVIGQPSPLTQVAHVDKDFNWSGEASEQFVFEKRLGDGAFGSVHLAYHKKMRFMMAIKTMEIKGELKEEIQSEINVLKKMDHPNIVRYFGCIIHDTQVWLMMDYCEGASILDFVKDIGASLTEEKLAAILKDTIKGLQYLHDKNIVHRDIKSANILVSYSKGVKIADFGVSHQLEKASEKVNAVVGTPLFMAPEALAGEDYDTRADIWSLGITAIEMADGKPPHHEHHVMRAMFLIAQNPPPQFRDPNKWSKDFNHFIMRCLQKKPSKRAIIEELISHPFVTKAAPSVIALQDLIEKHKQKHLHEVKAREEEKIKEDRRIAAEMREKKLQEGMEKKKKPERGKKHPLHNEVLKGIHNIGRPITLEEIKKQLTIHGITGDLAHETGVQILETELAITKDQLSDQYIVSAELRTQILHLNDLILRMEGKSAVPDRLTQSTNNAFSSPTLRSSSSNCVDTEFE